jgi:hypothetical protein
MIGRPVSTGRRPPPAKGEVEAAVLEAEQVLSADKPIKEAMLIIADILLVQRTPAGSSTSLGTLFARPRRLSAVSPIQKTPHVIRLGVTRVNLEWLTLSSQWRYE